MSNNPLGEKEEHPSYGMVGIFRTQGKIGKMFGSALEQHSGYISIQIKRGRRYHANGQDWYMADGRHELINIALTAAQFAELITTPNTGDGVPCTIMRLDGEMVENPPEDYKSEADRVQDEFADKIKEITDNIDPNFKEAIGLLTAAGTLKKPEREKIAKMLGRLQMEIKHGMPYAHESFQEATEKTVVAAKAEIDAALTGVIQRTGLKALQENAAAAIGLLEAPEEES